MPVDYNTELRLAYLRAAQAAIEEVEEKMQTYRSFYNSKQGLILTDRQKDYLGADAESLGNICKRTVNIVKDRLQLTKDGIAGADNTSQLYADAVTEWWGDNSLDAKQKDIYEASLRDSNVGVIVGYDKDNKRPTFTPNLLYDGKTGLLRFHYDNDNNLLFASKRWTTWDPLTPGATGKRRLTVYRDTQIERYEADSKQLTGWRFLEPKEIGGDPNPQPWLDTDGTPLGIPVIPFENPNGSELEEVIIIQKLLNHSLSTFDIATDFHGFPILWLVNAVLPKAADGTSQIPEFSPGTGILLGEGGKADRIEPADLIKMFQAGVLSWVQVLSIIKGWPAFLFDLSGNIPSGVALKILEGSLVNQVEDKQVVFSDAWKACFDMGRKLHRLAGNGDLQGSLRLTWKRAQTNDELNQIEIKEKKFTTGEIPIIQRLRELGYTEKQINQMLDDKRREDQFGLVDTITPLEQ